MPAVRTACVVGLLIAFLASCSAGWQSESPEIMGQTTAVTPIATPPRISQESAARIQQHYNDLYLNRIAPLLTAEQAAKVAAIGEIVFDPTTSRFTSIFVDPPAYSDRHIVIGYGGYAWCTMLAQAWLIEIERDESEAPFTPQYLLYVRKLYQPNEDPIRFNPFHCAGWEYANLSDRQKVLLHDLARGIYVFVVAHEVGHVVLGHQSGLPHVRAQQQEAAADVFACEMILKHVQMHTGDFPFNGIAAYLFGSAVTLERQPQVESQHPPAFERIADVAMWFLEHRHDLGLNEAECEAIMSVHISCQRALEETIKFAQELDAAAEKVTIESLMRTQPASDNENKTNRREAP